MNYIKITTFRGFTLAEVLITLVIIGVIAAMTVPTLLQNKEKLEAVTKTKKVYSLFSNVLKRSVVDNGDYQYWNITTGAYTDGKVEFEQYFKPYLSINTYCGVNQYGVASNKCFPYIPKGKDGSTQTWHGDISTFFILADGTNVRFHRSSYVNTGAGGAYFQIDFDINGIKEPNAFGKDIFTLLIWPQKGLSPDRYNWTRANLVTACNNNVATNYIDTGCLMLIIKDGWQISSDYVW